MRITGLIEISVQTSPNGVGRSLLLTGNSTTFTCMNNLTSIVVIISATAAFICFSINVHTEDLGGSIGTIVVPQDTPEEMIEQLRSALKVAGVGWICFGVLGLVWAARRSRGEPMFVSQNTHVRIPLLFNGGRIGLILGILGGFIFVSVVGSDSPEFRNYSGYIVCVYVVSITLILIGK